VLTLLQASSAFPLAFAPVPLSYQLDGRPQTASYLDGGVFDNTPLDLAIRMQVRLSSARGEPTADTHYLIQDPDNVVWDRPASAVAEAKHTLFGTWFPFLWDFIATTLQTNLMNTIQNVPDLNGRLELPARSTPALGAYLGEFLAFFETDFRVADFYSGMADAADELAKSSLAYQVMARAGVGAAIPPLAACVLAWRREDAFHSGRDPQACASLGEPTRSNLLTLLFATTTARQDGPDDEALLFDNLGRDWGREHHRFRFHDLTDDPADYGTPVTAEQARPAIRRIMQDVIVRFGRNQHNAMAELTVASVAKAAANYYVYRRPPAFFALGAITGGWLDARLDTPLDDSGLRADAELRAVDIHNVVLDPGPGQRRQLTYTFEGAAHLVYELQLQGRHPDLQSTVQFQLGLGYGMAWMRTVDGPQLWRHGPEAVLGASLFQRLFVSLSAMRFLDDCAWNNACSGADPAAAGHLAPLTTSNWDLHATLGVRLFLE
jgi:hypothetical protein